MQDLLNDIELDVRELKYLVQAIAGGSDPALRRVACRNIGQLSQRLNALKEQLENPEQQPEMPEQKPAVEQPETASEPSIPVADEMPQASVTPIQPAEEPVQEVAVAEEPVVAEVHPSVTEPAATPSPILAERIRMAADLRHAISLNDSFRFTRELFGGDAARMNEVLCRLGQAATLDDALALFACEVQADEDNQAAADFVELLHKYFN